MPKGKIKSQQAMDTASQFRMLLGNLGDAFAAIAEGRPPRVERLTMAEVVGFFVEHRPSVPDAEAAAIVRDHANPEQAQPADTAEYRVRLFFLDKEGRPLLGARQPTRAYLTRQFDDELAGIFGTTNVVIFS